MSLAGAHGGLALLVGVACGAGAAAQSRPSGSAAHLYWANSRNGTIDEASLNGTHAETIARRQRPPAGVAVGGGHLYWVTSSFSPGSNGTIVEAKLNGTHPEVAPRGVELEMAVLPPSSAAVGSV